MWPRYGLQRTSTATETQEARAMVRIHRALRLVRTMKKKPPMSSLTPEEYEARLKKILLSKLGQAWMFWPPRAEVKRRCAVPEQPGWYRCEKNPKHIVEKLEVDHIIPCVRPADGFVSWDDYIKSRFVTTAKKLQGLCTSCHREKSNEENKKRKEAKTCANGATLSKPKNND